MIEHADEVGALQRQNSEFSEQFLLTNAQPQRATGEVIGRNIAGATLNQRLSLIGRWAHHLAASTLRRALEIPRRRHNRPRAKVPSVFRGAHRRATRKRWPDEAHGRRATTATKSFLMLGARNNIGHTQLHFQFEERIIEVVRALCIGIVKKNRGRVGHVR
jgi:hypothetical protein